MPQPLRLVVAGLLSALVLLGASAPSFAGSYVEIDGTGSTWSQNIVTQWISDVSANGMQVVYTGGGSTKGRKDFANDTVDFAISEIPYQGTDELGNADTSNGRPYAYLPIVAGGTAFTYQLKVGNTMVRNLRLSGETLAKIFTLQITNWSDPAITKDNNGHPLPSLPITPVVRSDGSGTTAQFTTWMDKQYPSIWRPYFGRSGLTSYYPRKGRMIGQSGSDQVMNTIASSTGNGTIGYIEYSYPMNKTAADGKPFPVVKVLNRAGYYVEPTQYNVAVALTRAKINQDKTSQLYLTQILDGVYSNPDARAYPISSYSYMIIPTGTDAQDQRLSTAKRQTLADFLYYSLCTGQSKAGPYGYSPLPLNLVQAGFQQVGKLKQADPNVNLTKRDVTTCNNPTFVAGNLNKNKLAEIAPMPASCDKVGQGPCGTATGTNTPSTDANAGPTSAAGAPAPGTAAPGTTVGGTASGAGPAPGTAPGAGVPAGANVPAAAAPAGQVVQNGAPVIATPTELMASRPEDDHTFGVVAALELLALVTVPGFVAVWSRRRRPRSGV